jgi:hypothetical protein
MQIILAKYLMVPSHASSYSGGCETLKKNKTHYFISTTRNL